MSKAHQKEITVSWRSIVRVSSDEGDTSSSSGSENELNILNSDEEGFCCQAVPLVPPSSPVSPSKNRLNKRVNRKIADSCWTNQRKENSENNQQTKENTPIHCNSKLNGCFYLVYITRFQLQRTKGKTLGRPTMSTLKKSNKYHRSAIDLPTAEPYLECTSECDDYNESRLTSAKNSIRMHMQMKSGQRFQTNEKSAAAAAAMVATTVAASNNLVVVSSQKSDSNIEPESSKSILDAKDKYNNVAVSELPAIKGSKRHSAWQNMKK